MQTHSLLVMQYTLRSQRVTCYAMISVGALRNMAGVCLSVACLDLTRERKGPGSQKLEVWKPITRVTRELVRGQGHQAD